MALSAAFTTDGSRLAIGAGDRTIRYFDAATGKQLRVLRPHADWVQSVTFSPDRAHLLSASRDRTARITETATGQIETTYGGHETAALTAIFSRDGKTAFSLAQNSPVHVWETTGGETSQQPFPVSGRSDRLAFVNGGLAIGGADGLVVFCLPPRIHGARFRALPQIRLGTSIRKTVFVELAVRCKPRF